MRHAVVKASLRVQNDRGLPEVVGACKHWYVLSLWQAKYRHTGSGAVAKALCPRLTMSALHQKSCSHILIPCRHTAIGLDDYSIGEVFLSFSSSPWRVTTTTISPTPDLICRKYGSWPQRTASNTFAHLTCTTPACTHKHTHNSSPWPAPHNKHTHTMYLSILPAFESHSGHAQGACTSIPP